MGDFFHRGNTQTQTQDTINSEINKTLQLAINQAADNCLENDSSQDKTSRIKANNTVLYDDIEALDRSGNARMANQSAQYQQQLIQDRRQANLSFESAINTLTPQHQIQAIRVMNFAAEQIYKVTWNNRNIHSTSSPELTINSIAEDKISETKQALANQISNGTFIKTLTAYANNGMQTQCAHMNADVVDYDHR